MDPELEQALRQARTQRVELGRFSRDELWRYGVPLPNAGVSPSAPMTSDVPRGPRLFRLAMRPPRAVFSTATADAGADWEWVDRFGELIEREVARVRETTDRNRTFQLSLQPLRMLIEQALADAGMGDRQGAASRSRLFAAFPFRFVAAPGRGLRRGARLRQEPFPEDERLWLQLTVEHSAAGTTLAEERSARARHYPPLAPDAEPAGIVSHVLDFYRAFWPELPSG